MPVPLPGPLSRMAGGARIALIDGDEALVRVLRELLESVGGYEVLACTKGGCAHDFVRAHRPDLILLDVHRLGGEPMGWNVLDLLTLDGETRGIPVLVLTADPEDIRDQPILELFGIKVLTKPFGADVLLEGVRTALAM